MKIVQVRFGVADSMALRQSLPQPLEDLLTLIGDLPPSISLDPRLTPRHYFLQAI